MDKFLYFSLNRKHLMADNKSLAILAAVALIVFFGCTKELGVVPREQEKPVEACDTITYSKHIGPLVELRCRSCHSPDFPSNPNGQDLANYQDLKELVNNGKLRYVIFEATGNQKMPQGTELTAEEKSRIDCFIRNGGKQ